MKHLRHIVLLLAVLMVSCKQEAYYNVTTHVEPPEGGVVVINPSAGQVLEGTSVTFTAQPKGDYVFSGWGGSLSGTENPKTVTVNSNLTVTASFVLREYPLSISIEGEGSVSERVISTKTDYSSGTVVELTALPATGWSFDHWEGDFTGADNPITITISSAKSVKAVFTKNHYAYNLKIIGPGVVDEYLLTETKSVFGYNERILLKAIPSTGAVFTGWSGDASGDATELELVIDGDKDIVASFSGVANTYPLPDLKQPWVNIKRLYKDFDFRLFSNDASGRSWTPVDYNRDGYLDVITSETFKENYYESDSDIHFYLGNPDGTFSSDPQNDNRIIGKEPRKVMYADFNNDDKPDILMVGHGTEQPGARVGVYPIILMSSPSGKYEAVRFEDLWGYNHGGTIGDFDNDGDVDIILPDAMGCVTHTLVNDGTGSFRVDDELVFSASGIFFCELYDIDHDGFLDLIWGGGTEIKWDGGTWRAEVLWGTGQGFNESNKRSFLLASEKSLRGFLDVEFIDLDGDGIDEIVSATTEDYDCWGIEIYKYVGNDFVDVTAKYFEPGDSFGPGENWVGLIDFEEIDGVNYLVCRQFGDRRILFEYKHGKFFRIAEEKQFVPQEGFCVYHDPWAPINYIDDFVRTKLCFHCTENPHSGDYCIKNEPEDWGWGFGFSDVFNGADLRKLVSEGYCLEFYIRHEQPIFLVEVKFCSEPENSIGGNTFSYGYFGSEHPSNGEWERIVIPLNSMDSWEDETKESWGKINSLYFCNTDQNKAAFFIDDIRIRKVLPE